MTCSITVHHVLRFPMKSVAEKLERIPIRRNFPSYSNFPELTSAPLSVAWWRGEFRAGTRWGTWAAPHHGAPKDWCPAASWHPQESLHWGHSSHWTLTNISGCHRRLQEHPCEHKSATARPKRGQNNYRHRHPHSLVGYSQGTAKAKQ